MTVFNERINNLKNYKRFPVKKSKKIQYKNNIDASDRKQSTVKGKMSDTVRIIIEGNRRHL